MGKYLFYIIFLVFSNVANANQVLFCNIQDKQITDEINADIAYSNTITDEFIDETDNDLSKHLIICAQKAGINFYKETKLNSNPLRYFSNKRILLNYHLDLPPPSIS